MSTRDLEEMRSLAAEMIASTSSRHLANQINEITRAQLRVAIDATACISPRQYAEQSDAFASYRESEQQLRGQISRITGVQTNAISGATASHPVSPDYLKQFDALAPLREREQQLRDQISGIVGKQAMALSGVYGAERLTNLAARAMDHHSSLFTREAERISRMVSDAGYAFREQAECLANIYEEQFSTIFRLNEQALHAVAAQPDWFNGTHEAAGMSVASIARNLIPDVTGIFSARTLAHQLTQRSQESMLTSLMKGIDPLQHASKAFELFTRRPRELNLSAAQEHVRAFVESPAYEHIRSMTAMIAEAMAAGDEARARAAWKKAADDEAFSDAWRKFQAFLYYLLQPLLLLHRRTFKGKGKFSVNAFLNEHASLIAAAALLVGVFQRPIERGWDSLFPLSASSTPTAGQSVQLTYFRVTGDDVRLRSAPSTKQLVVATVDRGDVVQRLGVCKTWSLVALHTGRNDGKPISGWIKSDYLKHLEKGVDPSAVSKPVVVDGCDE